MQLTTQLGEKASQGKNVDQQKHSGDSGSATQSEAIRDKRTTVDLLNWADDIGAQTSLTGDATADLEDPELLESEWLDAVASSNLEPEDQQMTSSQAAAKALLKAAQHSQKRGRGNTTASRYMGGKGCTHPLKVLDQLYSTRELHVYCMCMASCLFPGYDAKFCYSHACSTLAHLSLVIPVL